MAFLNLLGWGNQRPKKKRRPQRPRRALGSSLGHGFYLEALEDRSLLSVTLNPISGPDANSAFVVPAGKDLYVPLIGTDLNQTISYSASSSDPAIHATVLSGNPTLSFTVHGTTANNQAFSGTMTFQLFQNIAPQTVQGIVNKVNAGLFNGSSFYRMETAAGFQLIQGGIEKTPSKTDPVKLPDEFNVAASFNSSGLLAMASAGPGTAASEFFVTAPNRPLVDQPQSLNYGYTIFGQILTGLDIYNDVLNAPTTSSGGINYAKAPITIDTASIITDTQNGVLQISEPNNYTGNPTITVTASATDSTTAQQSFQMNVAPPAAGAQNVPPLFLSPVVNQTTVQGTPVTLQLTANGSTSGLSFSVTGDSSFTATPQNVTVSSSPISGSSQTFTLTPTAGFTGTIHLVAHADSSSGVHDAQAFTLTVNPFQVTIISVTNPINLINAASTSIQGMGLSGDTVSVVAGDGTHTTAAKTTTVDANGNWSISGLDVSALTDGTITYTASETGATSTQSTKTATKDTVAPTISMTTVTNPVTIANAASTAVSGTSEAGLTVSVVAGDGTNTTAAKTTTVASNGTWSISGLDVTSLKDGTITYTATVADAAGNSAHVSNTATKKALELVSVTNPINPGNLNNTSASGTGEVGANISVVAGDGTHTTAAKTTTVDASGAWSISGLNVTSLNDGTITYTATATDSSNNSIHTSKTATKSSLATASLSGFVYFDSNGNNAKDSAEPGLQGALLTLTGIDLQSNPVPSQTIVTDGNGAYSFHSLPAGTYAIREAQPLKLTDGASIAGSLGGAANGSLISNIVVASDNQGTGYNFGERGLDLSVVSTRLFLASTPPVQQVLGNIISTYGTVAPFVTAISKASADPSSAGTVDYTVTFNQHVSGVDATDFKATATSSITGVAIQSVTGSGNSYTVTVQTGSGNGFLRLDLVDNDSITNSANIPLATAGTGNGNFTGPTYTINKSATTFAVAVSTVTDPINLSNASNTSASGTAEAGANISVVASDGTHTTAAKTTTVASNGTWSVSGLDVTSLNNGPITFTATATDTVNNSAQSSKTATKDTFAPDVIAIALADASPTNSATVHYTVTFSESVTGVSSSNFALVPSGLTNASIASVTGSGTTYTVTVNTGGGAGTLGLNLANAAGIQDSVGNPLSTTLPFVGSVYTITAS